MVDDAASEALHWIMDLQGSVCFHVHVVVKDVCRNEMNIEMLTLMMGRKQVDMIKTYLNPNRERN